MAYDLPDPLGFPKCAKCAFLSAGDPVTCASCVAASAPLTDPRCPTCSRPTPSGTCGNPVCNWDDRAIGVVHAACKRTGAIEGILKRFKYDPGNAGWAPILGRIVTGWLFLNDVAVTYDLIVVNPTDPSREPIRHTEEILKAASAEDQLGIWPFDALSNPTLIKTRPTTSASAKGTRWRAKYDAAQELWSAVEVARPGLVRGKKVLVVDDVTTTLLQLNVIAGLLRAAGAAHVDGLVIARSV